MSIGFVAVGGESEEGAAPVSGCATCDDYQFVPGGTDGLLRPCPDCNVGIVRCPVHGRRARGGHCPACQWEATAGELLIAAQRAADDAKAPA